MDDDEWEEMDMEADNAIRFNFSDEVIHTALQREREAQVHNVRTGGDMFGHHRLEIHFRLELGFPEPI